MKVSPRLPMLAVLALGLAVGGSRAVAQPFDLSVTSPPGIVVSNTLTYTINVTNQTGSAVLTYVTNAWSSPVPLLSATANLTFGIETNSAGVTFVIDPFTFPSFAQFTVSVQPINTGFITNTVTVSTASTNVVTSFFTLVTNAPTVPTITADLAVAILPPPQPVIANDFITYWVIVSNLGTNDAPNVFLTNTLPAGVGWIGPAQTTLALGTLAISNSVYLPFRVQPTNTGTLPFVASVASADVIDPNPTNNTATTNIVVTNYLSGHLTISIVSTQIFDSQNGLMEQAILLSNTGPSNVASARIVVTNLTATNWLFNASGTNNGNPFVVYATNLAPAQSVTLRMQYDVFNRLPFSTTNLAQAFEVPQIDLTPPPMPILGTFVAATNLSFFQLPSGDMLVEFPAISNRNYTVVYSDDSPTNNIKVALPSINAVVDRMQWIDYGPPTTTAHPTNVTVRFYGVFLSP